MITIFQPQKYIVDLLGKPDVNYGDSLRLMKYVIQVEHEGDILLHNVITGQLVKLDLGEIDSLNNLHIVYSRVLDGLVNGIFLVPESYDEHLVVIKLRTVIRKLYDIQGSKDITSYTILPTTACNARCYYCFEKGLKNVTMSEQTAKDVVGFISDNCGSKKKVRIRWFGGEPTVAAYRIDQICEGLQEKNINYISSITTNGYLLEGKMIDHAKTLWNLEYVNISMDGSESSYNKIKSYINPVDNPYLRVLRNIGLLLDEKIRVRLRMNFDLGNYLEFQPFVQDLISRFGDNPLLSVNAHPVNGEYEDEDNNILHGTEEWFSEKIVQLNDFARKSGLMSNSLPLPSLVALGCKASSNSSVTITPEGNLVRCPEQLDDDQITGNVRVGIVNKELVLAWKQLTDYEVCHDCFMFPHCLKIKNCSVKGRCSYRREYSISYKNAIKKHYMAFLNNENL